MTRIIGIRREDKNRWEKRVPLVPTDVEGLNEKHGIETLIQPSEIRVFSDVEYTKAGARVDENLANASVVFAVKEIPIELLEAKKTYVFFSHTIKKQPYNMDMLKRLMELKCNLIDYERMSDKNDVRIITFSFYAGMAGIIETFYAFNCKTKRQGIRSPFPRVKQAYHYSSVSSAREELTKIGLEISKKGVPEEIHPLTIGILGYGNVSKGVQEILDLLPVKSIPPAQIKQGLNGDNLDNRFVYKTVFKEEDMVKPCEGQFDLQDYYSHPDKYVSTFNDYLPHLRIVLNCVYWTEGYPRTITCENLKEDLSRTGKQRLQIIGDISCDINGSVEITREATKPDNACYTYYPERDEFEDGIQNSGITVMAIDNLPCEFSREASSSFSSTLKPFVNDIVSADFKKDFCDLILPDEIKKAVILLNGSLTPNYRYITESSKNE